MRLVSALQKDKSRVFGLFLLFVITRLIFFYAEKDDFLYRLPAQDDAPAYLEIASVFKGENTYASIGRSPFARVPVYSAILAVLPGNNQTRNLYLLFVLQQISQFLVIVLVYLYLMRSCSARVAIVLTIILSVFYDPLMYGFLVRPESFFALEITIGTLLFARSLAVRNNKGLFLAAIIFSLAALTRPIAALSIVPMLLLTIILLRLKKETVKTILISMMIVLIGFILPLSPWIYRNYKLSGQFVIQIDTGNIIHATVPGGHWSSVDIHSLVDTKGRTSLAIDRELTQIAIRRIIDNPAIWIRNTISNFTFRLWSMGFADTYLRYLDHISDTGGYHRSGDFSLGQRLLASWNIMDKSIDINPFYHVYFVFNNFLGLVIIFLPLMGLVLFPYFSTNGKIHFSFLLYFWIFTSFFAFSGSRYMVPFIPLLVLVLPDYKISFMRLIGIFKTGK